MFYADKSFVKLHRLRNLYNFMPKVFEIHKNFAVSNTFFASENMSKCIDAAIECPVNAIVIED